ncbi:MAG: hypothetical protein KatS3mg132_167 [Limisphaera sp.]|nr:MAG: hypothetical protein KatS3mg132_167 [Limisphaera sp.]
MNVRALLAAGVLLAAPAPSLPAPWEGWVDLFDGHSLRGWRASEHPATFRVEDGAIVAEGPRAHLFYVGRDGEGAEYRNFELEAELRAAPGANSGIYFHTAWQETGWPARGFEVQINNSARPHNGYWELKKTGSLYGLRNVYKQLVPDDTWFRLRIVVEVPRVRVFVNDHWVVDYVEPEPPVAPGSRPGRRLGRGTFALQGHDPESRVEFRRIRVRRLPDDLAAQVERPRSDATWRQMIELGMANFPLVDFHAHLKGGLTLEEVLTQMRRTGMNYGLAVNGGLGFAVTNDAAAQAWLDGIRNAPVLAGLQAEGREWTRLFSASAVARFDYVFTDAMTLTDRQGRRVRLWIPEEVKIEDPEAFMDHLVETIVRILETEPIDFYANPTYLPDVLAPRYDELWTPERRRRVIEAAARNGVAIEINSRLELPKPEFIREARAAGVKFTLGTNNPDRELLPHTYALRMIRECGLGWQDMWMPRPNGEKPVQRRGLPR